MPQGFIVCDVLIFNDPVTEALSEDEAMTFSDLYLRKFLSFYKSVMLFYTNFIKKIIMIL